MLVNVIYKTRGAVRSLLAQLALPPSCSCLPPSPRCTLLAEVLPSAFLPRSRYRTTCLRWSSTLRISRSVFHPSFPLCCLLLLSWYHMQSSLSLECFKEHSFLSLFFSLSYSGCQLHRSESYCFSISLTVTLTLHLALWPCASHLPLNAHASSCVKWG